MATAWEKRCSRRRLEFNFNCNHAGTRSHRKEQKQVGGSGRVWACVCGLQPLERRLSTNKIAFDGRQCSANCKLLPGAVGWRSGFCRWFFSFRAKLNFSQIWQSINESTTNKKMRSSKYKNILGTAATAVPKRRYATEAEQTKNKCKIKTKARNSPAKRGIHSDFPPLPN